MRSDELTDDDAISSAVEDDHEAPDDVYDEPHLAALDGADDDGRDAGDKIHDEPVVAGDVDLTAQEPTDFPPVAEDIENDFTGPTRGDTSAGYIAGSDTHVPEPADEDVPASAIQEEASAVGGEDATSDETGDRASRIEDRRRGASPPRRSPSTGSPRPLSSPASAGRKRGSMPTWSPGCRFRCWCTPATTSISPTASF
ncbi:MAG: hypothetical protein NVV63_00040 [Opitutus sp.]|nr:hypothetical protein [Opitutus sp.]